MSRLFLVLNTTHAYPVVECEIPQSLRLSAHALGWIGRTREIAVGGGGCDLVVPSQAFYLMRHVDCAELAG